jgi:hypothetical protein
MIHHPILREMQGRSKNRNFELNELMMFSHHMLERMTSRPEKSNPASGIETGDKSTRA